jgi:asparagine synthase (glutamine-hydrolysing)
VHPNTRLRGASAGLVRSALDDADPLPGTAGFAGVLDGVLVRDVLGRQPVFHEAGHAATWEFDPALLSNPVPVSAGHVVGGETTTRAWTLPDPPPRDDHESAVAAVAEAVRRSVDEPPTANLAVAFSGGVDSALVAAGAPEAPCYVCGFPDSHDVTAARTAAEAMNRDLRVVELDHESLERAVPEVVRATGRTNAMDIQIALPLYLVAERAAADGYERLALGQGADELFGGYAKVVDPADDPRVDATTVREARTETMRSLPDQLERDVLALRAAGVEPVLPLLHDRVVRAALPLPGPLLATRDERKVALRRASRGLVPPSVRRADKKAVQYGSLVARELDRLARQAGYKRRIDDHVGQYVRSLAGPDA